MTRFFKYFQFNSVERKGFIVLILVVLLVNMGLIIYQWTRPKAEIIHQLYTLQEDQPNLQYENTYAVDISKPYPKTKDARKEIAYFIFDPNTASATQWSQLGFSANQTRVILNYLAKGGHFYKKEDLKKIYSISENEYNKLEPYIRIHNKSTIKHPTTERGEFKTNSSAEYKSIKIDLNTADTSEIKRLKGIGNVLAARIIKFRDALGGFHHIAQLREVYGIKEETFIQIRDNLTVSTQEIKKLNINTIDLELLSKHPYVSKKQAQIIINYRVSHGPYSDLNNLSQNKALDQEFLRKIEPYLEF